MGTVEKMPISIVAEKAQLPGELALPESPRGLIIIARPGGDGSDAGGARAAEALQQQGFATLRIDLLALHEAQYPDNHDNIPLLARRLLACIDLMHRQDGYGTLPIGLFGHQMAAAAAIRIAALRDNDVFTVAGRDVLIDLAGVQNLRLLRAPLLVLLAASESHRIAAAQRAFPLISCEKQIERLPDLDPDSTDQAADHAAAQLAAAWFARWMPAALNAAA